MSPSYHYAFEPGTDPSAPPLLLLHGTGGDEHSLLDLGRALSPGSALLSPRGDVNERGALRFFRRLAEGVFDLEDVRRRTHALADFLASAAPRHGLASGSLVAVGFSNGANLAGTLLQLRPEVLAGAVLFRAMVVLDRPAPADALRGRRVLLANGEADPLVPSDHPSRLARLFEAGGADVTLRTFPVGHNLTAGDVTAAQAFLRP
jgi:predicted esterase